MDTAPPRHKRLNDASCIRCGYDLRGLADDGVCPECALPVRRSRERTELLRSADIEWVRTIRTGLHMLERAMIAFFILAATFVVLFIAQRWGLGAARLFSRGGLSNVILAALWLIVGGMHIYGCLLISRQSHGNWALRPWMRTGVLACGIALPISVAATLFLQGWLRLLPQPALYVLFAVFQANGVVFCFALAATLEHIERRTRWWSRALALRHRGVRWNLYVLVGFILFFYWLPIMMPRIGIGLRMTDWGLVLFGLAYIFFISAVGRVRSAVVDEVLVADAMELAEHEKALQ